MATKSEQISCTACGSCAHPTDQCWADISDTSDTSDVSFPLLVPSALTPVIKVKVNKPSYAFVAKTGVPDDDTCAAMRGSVCDSVQQDSAETGSSDFSDFTVVKSKSAKKESIAKCESALTEWVKNKGSRSVTKCSSDEQLVCKRCSAPFVFSEQAKEKYAERGWKVPKICKPCSQARFEDKV